jgi:hypothetical protein
MTTGWRWYEYVVAAALIGVVLWFALTLPPVPELGRQVILRPW